MFSGNILTIIQPKPVTYNALPLTKKLGVTRVSMGMSRQAHGSQICPSHFENFKRKSRFHLWHVKFFIMKLANITWKAFILTVYFALILSRCGFLAAPNRFLGPNGES